MTAPSESFSKIVLNIHPPVARLSFNAPPLNVIDIGMMQELAEAFAAIESRSDVSIVVLAGCGTTFSAGVEVAAHTPAKAAHMLGNFHAVVRALVASAKVFLATVRGHCLGGGAELAMLCDIVITADDANWGFPEIELGCFPPVAAVALSAVVGQKRAAELVLTGRQFNGVEAQKLGLANFSVAGHLVDEKSTEIISRLSGLSPAALALTKKALCAWDAVHFDQGLTRAEKIYLDELMKTHDAEEGIAAFLEKRCPSWKGK